MAKHKKHKRSGRSHYERTMSAQCRNCGHGIICHPDGRCMCSHKPSRPSCRMFINPLPEATSAEEEKAAAAESVAATETASIADQSIVNFEQTPAEEEPKDEKSKLKKMKAWPKDQTAMIPYSELVAPMKEIINRGYTKWTRNNLRDFDYEGYNIGRIEREAIAPPNQRFTEKMLAEDAKNGKSLLDVVFQYVFMLGIEQGRRAERQESIPVHKLIESMQKYRKDNINLRYALDIAKAKLEMSKAYPDMSDEELKPLVKTRVDELKPKRFEIAKAELGEDVLKTHFKFAPKRASFKELEKLATDLHKKKDCSLEQWLDLLKQKGWKPEEWDEICTKKKLDIKFEPKQSSIAPEERPN